MIQLLISHCKQLKMNSSTAMLMINSTAAILNRGKSFGMRWEI